jgi:probable F420-dependent oxidoreductase
MARRARSAGFDGFFVPEASHDPFVALGAASQVAGSMDLGTAVTVAFARSPMVTAMAAWDLARSSRFLLGLGTQVSAHIRGRFSTEWSDPTGRLRDYVASLRAIWGTWQRGDRLNHRGPYYRFTLMTPFFDPGPIARPDIPVWLAGVGPRATRLAAEIADGFHVHPFHTVRYLDEVILPLLKRDRPVPTASSVLVATGGTSEELEAAKTIARSQIAFYASTPAYRRVLELHDWVVGPELSSMARGGRWDSMGSMIDEDMLDAVAVVSPIDELGARLRDRYEGRLDRIGIYPSVALTEREWSLVVAGIRG